MAFFLGNQAPELLRFSCKYTFLPLLLVFFLIFLVLLLLLSLIFHLRIDIDPTDYIFEWWAILRAISFSLLQTRGVPSPFLLPSPASPRPSLPMLPACRAGTTAASA
ncbi:hypothetical protein HPP92_023351 [Vanilla planifolia]|uniref:Uncharacterized protein n=1 Tax=Vanilla planifolia TaxID=51239 RepID=A0A835PRB3_VANPL|nr:hypothetical protein HPP92_023351 [Vanilla planifolia]